MAEQPSRARSGRGQTEDVGPVLPPDDGIDRGASWVEEAIATHDIRARRRAALLAERFRDRATAVCPVCFAEMSTSCHMTYNTYRCWSCGVSIDGRAGRPLSMDRDEAKAKHAAWEAGEDG